MCTSSDGGLTFNQAAATVIVAPRHDGGFCSEDAGSPSCDWKDRAPTIGDAIYFDGFSEFRRDPYNYNPHELGRAVYDGANWIQDRWPQMPHENINPMPHHINGINCVWTDNAGTKHLYLNYDQFDNEPGTRMIKRWTIQ